VKLKRLTAKYGLNSNQLPENKYYDEGVKP